MKREKKQKTKNRLKTGLLIAAFALLATNAKTLAQPLLLAPLVEITEVKNVGVSANNDSKSIVQAQWSVNTLPTLSIKSFDLVIEVAYADGAIEQFKTTAGGAERKARFEVPTQHLATGKSGAGLRSFKANITASFTETAVKQGNF
jgi:hypothetical protein